MVNVGFRKASAKEVVKLNILRQPRLRPIVGGWGREGALATADCVGNRSYIGYYMANLSLYY